MATMNKSMTALSGIADKAQHTASDVANVAREQVTTRVNTAIKDQKMRAAASIGGIASALRDGSLDQNELLSDYVSRAADGLDQATSYFREKELGEIVGDVERFARREPALFLGGAFALGLVAARFLKSSSRPQYAFDEDRLATLPREPMASLPRVTPRPLAPPAVSTSAYGSVSSYGATPPVDTNRTTDPLPGVGVKASGNGFGSGGSTL